jgi:hypothetical protein
MTAPVDEDDERIATGRHTGSLKSELRLGPWRFHSRQERAVTPCATEEREWTLARRRCHPRRTERIVVTGMGPGRPVDGHQRDREAGRLATGTAANAENDLFARRGDWGTHSQDADIRGR